MSIVALDLGTKNIGVAYSPDGLFSFPLPSIKRSDLPSDIEAIRKVVLEKNANLLVVGYPASEVESEWAKFVRGFASKLKEALGIDIALVNESLTSIEARKLGHEMGKTDKQMRGNKDAIEAQLILMRYMETFSQRITEMDTD
ncbi:MAG: Holliday junction resolvase RuvX [Caldisericales bacterium]|nr:Holliday junction resolvase RuvX [Caldisericales bacterium]